MEEALRNQNISDLLKKISVDSSSTVIFYLYYRYREYLMSSNKNKDFFTKNTLFNLVFWGTV